MGDVGMNDSMKDIAIVGVAGRFPKARNLDEFWNNLREGIDCISSFSDEELRLSGTDPALISNPSYVRRKAVIEDIDLFDARLFGFNPGEAEVIDPQHRLFLESSYEVLDNAGYDPQRYEGLIGVYAGCSANSYLINNLLPNKDILQRLGSYQVFIANDKDFLTTRVSYKLNLKGPSVDVQTACSTSLVAVHLACQSLLNYECDMAIAGGVSIMVPQKTGYLYQDGMILSPDGFCRAFDAKAQGTVGGEGAGVVLLKRLADAVADGDYIRAVIKASAINNDGSLKAGYTAPSVEGQAEVIATAQAAAGISAESISYVETHGTGTSLGDPIEIAALTKAFRSYTEKTKFCAIGSLKTNIGHLDTAAGVANLIKTVLSLEHKMLLPSLHFDEPNPLIDFERSPFFVNKTLSQWKKGDGPRRAGVSSFGIGGTNAHVIVEEAPVREPSGPSRPWQLLTLSAKTETALERMTGELIGRLKEDQGTNLADIAYTLQVGRRTFGNRRVAVCRTVDDVISVLEAADEKDTASITDNQEDRGVVFMFSGQGSQYVNMALDLYETEATFRETVDFCSEFLKPHLGCDLREILYPDSEGVEEATDKLTQTAITQPALFVIEYALTRLWEEWGIRPRAMIGHSIGEYVAACLAGVFSLEDALTLVAARGRLIQSLPRGTMLAVYASEKETLGFLNEGLSLAVVNAPSLCVVSGTEDSIGKLEGELTHKGVGFVRLHTSHAFHSKMMEPILGEFVQRVGRVTLNEPRIRYLSNVTGTWITDAEATDPAYWAKHLRHTVRFADGVSELAKTGHTMFLEVGPGRTLAGLAEQCTADYPGRVVLSSVRHPKEQGPDDAFLLKTLGRLWLNGANVDWKGFHGGERRFRVPLPSYPFERERYWVESGQDGGDSETRTGSILDKRGVPDWFYVPSWKRSAMPHVFEQEAPAGQKPLWLIFLDESGLGRKMLELLTSHGKDVVGVIAGETFKREENRATYTINPHSGGDYEALLNDLAASRRLPGRIVHLWSLDVPEDSSKETDELGDGGQHGFYSLLFLTQALGDLHLDDAVRIDVISNNMQEVSGNEALRSGTATMLGLCRTIPQEYPKIACRSIDLSCEEGYLQNQELADRLLREFAHESADTVVAYRGPHRWAQFFDHIRLDYPPEILPSLLKMEGVYVITGGLGGIGLALAESLARSVKAKLFLIGRSPFPRKEAWTEWFDAHDGQDKVSRRIEKLKSLEDLGADVVVTNADVCDPRQMEQAIDEAFECFGRIDGVIHAAGIAGTSIMQRTTPETARAVLAAKVKGTRILYGLLKERKLDFFVCCSSINSILSSPGQGAYNAASNFLDAFALANNLRNGTRVISIDWDSWQEVGMAVDTEVPTEFRQAREENLRSGILSAEGIEAFYRVLGSGLPQVVVSTRDLNERIKLWNSPDTVTRVVLTERGHSSASRHARPKLSVEFVAPRSLTEQGIAEIWQELLSLEEVGIHDNFFELGGHSLLGTQVMSRIYQSFSIQLPLRKLFEVGTVEGLANLIDFAHWNSESPSAGDLLSEEREIIEI